MSSLSHSLSKAMSELLRHEGLREKKAQTSLSILILDSLRERCWWNNRRSLFRITDFLLTLLLIEIAHFIEGDLIVELILLT